MARTRGLLEQDRWREALLAARALAVDAPGEAEVVSVLGEALYRAGRIEEAISWLVPLAECEKPPARALLTLGLARKAEGRLEDAAALVERAFAMAPTDRHVIFWAADAAGTSTRRVELFEAYLALASGDDSDRVEAARGSLALLRAMAGRKVWIPVATPERVEIPLRPLASRGRVRGFTLEASLGDGPPVRLLLDTGSTGVFLLERVAKRHGLSPLSQGTTFGGGGKQRHRTGRGILPSFAVAGLSFKDALVTTTTEEIEPTGRYHGIVGLQIFSGYRIDLDLERAVVTLDSPGEPGSGEPYWEVSGQILARAGVPSAPNALFVIDTGAVGTVLSTRWAEEVAGARLGGLVGVRGFGGKVSARSVRGVRLLFQGTETRSWLVAADLSLQSRLSGVEVSGLLGLDFLLGKRLLIDTRAQQMRLVTERSPAR